MENSNSLVELNQIDKSYSGVQVLKSAHLSVAAGEVHGLIGENGAGKSTLVRILAGEIASDGGSISWAGRPTAIQSRADAERLGITMIHQELSLAPHLTVAQNIFLGHEPGQRGWARRVASAVGAIDRGDELAEARSLLERLEFDLEPRSPVRSLAPGQKQLVEIARAVARATRLVIMDEPTSSLSAKEVDELFRVIRQMKATGTAAIFVTHRMEELAEVADRVTVLRDGETVHEGTMPRRDFRELIRAMVGRELKDFYPSRAPKIAEYALQVEGLSRYAEFHDISFGIRRGEIVGLAGLIGAGRTELVESIFGAAPCSGGRILVEGGEVVIRSPQDAIRHGMALITEDRKRTGLMLMLGVAQNISVANLTGVMRGGCLDLKRESDVARGFVERLRIRCHSVGQRVARLSGGNQQKVVLAKWLFRQPRIFIFDEPTRGVDVGAKAEIYKLMNELAESGAAILMVSSELPEILGMTDRVLVMRSGRLVRELVTARTSQEEIIRYATLGE